MKLFMVVHDAQIDECTVQEMELALKIVAQVIRNGTAEKIVEMA
jgi:hypothetical protein